MKFVEDAFTGRGPLALDKKIRTQTSREQAPDGGQSRQGLSQMGGGYIEWAYRVATPLVIV